MIQIISMYCMHNAFSLHKGCIYLEIRIQFNLHLFSFYSNHTVFCFQSTINVIALCHYFICKYIVDMRYLDWINIKPLSNIFCILKNTRAHRNKYKILKSGKKNTKEMCLFAWLTSSDDDTIYILNGKLMIVILIHKYNKWHIQPLMFHTLKHF